MLLEIGREGVKALLGYSLHYYTHMFDYVHTVCVYIIYVLQNMIQIKLPLLRRCTTVFYSMYINN